MSRTTHGYRISLTNHIKQYFLLQKAALCLGVWLSNFFIVRTTLGS
jgi:hypothetical protein